MLEDIGMEALALIEDGFISATVTRPLAMYIGMLV